VRCKGNKILQPRLASGSGATLGAAQHRPAIFHQHRVPFDTDEVDGASQDVRAILSMKLIAGAHADLALSWGQTVGS
jgi:hypothetical protein